MHKFIAAYIEPMRDALVSSSKQIKHMEELAEEGRLSIYPLPSTDMVLAKIDVVLEMSK